MDLSSQQKAAPQSWTLHLLYHELRSEPSAYSYVIDNKQFDAQVDLLARLRQANAVGLWPEITFDDGHISNYELALPVLQTRGVKARFFITVGWTGRKSGYMGWAELRALQQAGQSIGAHGWTHTLLTHCSGRDLHTELEKSRHTLEDKLGASVTTMSLPGGRFNRRVLDACREAGYTRVYTSIPQAEPEPLGFTVGRLNIRRDMQLDWIAGLFQPGSRGLAALRRQYRRKETAKTVLGDRLYEKLWALLNRKEPESDGGDAGAGE
ncbi:MAG: polysaccharide deacetylase family protein [Acidobacteriaceae bacterium]